VPEPASRLTDDDLHLFAEGSHLRLHHHLGAKLVPADGDTPAGAAFSVWAPNARAVHVVTDANDWDATANPLAPRATSGIWEGFVPGASAGDPYRYSVTTVDGEVVEHADPMAIHTETPSANASKLWELSYDWGDDDWMATRGDRQDREAPISIYEVHLGSWQRGEDGERFLTYRELAPHLVAHVQRAGFTHVELLPVMEHPFYGSWGYQTSGYFAPTSRYGAPEDLMWLIDQLHQAGIGVLLDWVPSHFPDDWWALATFDGTHLYDHEDPRRGIHPDWNSAMFNYGRGEVRSFLLSSAMSWLERYHADGLRLDAVSSMLYLDYSREPGEWFPNEHGGNEHLEAVNFLQRLHDEIDRHHPDTVTFAEESTAWDGVTRSTQDGGLGFDHKWDLGWMHDTLDYIRTDPLHRSGKQDQLTFRSVYAASESFCLPLSHDEVSTARARCCRGCPVTPGSSAPTSGCCSACSSRRPARSCCSWGPSSGPATGGRSRRSSTGTCCTTPTTPRC
jgi:1,4-alpha-glucan branching enzyme